MNRDQPLDGLRSIKVKLAVLVGLSIVAASIVSEAGDRASVPIWLTMPVTVAAALGVTLWLARGVTQPLREMTSAATVMATGDYSRRVTATSTDEVGELARAFNTMAADLAAADRQRRQLISTVSHELRTPLTAQRALLENLADGVVSPDSDALHTALAQAERLSSLVSDLLDLSRIDGGVAQLAITTVDVATLVQQAVAEARGHARIRGIDIESSVGDGLRVTADEGRLAQVLANLLDNAVRHSPDGGTVSVSTDALPDGRWELEVHDDGPGIPAERAEQVFDRYGTWDESGGGTGLGLAIASWVCELHGGSISVVPGSGARVRAVLPMKPSPLQPLPTRPKEQVVTQLPPAPPIAPPPVPDPVVDSVFGSMWPEKGLSTRKDLVAASTGIGLVAAILLPYHDLGLGVLIVLLLCGALVLSASVRRRAPWTVASALLALGLSALVVVRSAEWITVLSVFIVGILVTTALTGARGIFAMIGGALSWGFAAIRGLPLLGRTLKALARLSVVWPVLRTVALSLVVIVIFGGLFASGDAIFGSWVSAIVPDLNIDGLVLRVFTGVFVAGMVLTATYVAVNPPDVNGLALPGGRRVARTFEWLVPLGAVIALFAAFVVAQAAAMWGGHDYVQRTTGMTYAEYVHQGFGQLTAVTFLTLVIIAIAARKVPRETRREQILQAVVFGALCSLALVVVASALYRMHVYQEAYGFTVLRILVDAFELWLGLLLVFVMIARIRLSGRWLPRAALFSAAIFALVIGFANPEAWVAERNIERYHETGKLDTLYLRSLGPDATPAIVDGLPRELAECILYADTTTNGDILEWNLGRARAADALAELPDTVPDCTWVRSQSVR